MNAKFIAILVVAAVAMAGVGVYFLINDGGEKYSQPVELSDTALTVMGNVNGDEKIDSDDVTLLEKIIKDEKQNEYPLADVNNDGKVDSKDIEALKNIVNKEKMKVYVIDDSNKTIEVQYPLKNVITINPDMLSLIIALGAKDKLVAFTSSVYEVEQAYVRSSENIEDWGKGRAFNNTSYSKFVTLSGKLANDGGVGGILYMSETSLGDYRGDFETAGVPLIWVNCSGPIDYAKSALKLGFLFGGDFVEKGQNIYADTMEIIDNVSKKLGDKERVKCISLTMVTYINQKNSQYTLLTTLAGGNNIVDIEGDGSTKLQADSIVKYDDAKYIISFSTMDLVKKDIAKTWKKSPEQMAVLEASKVYENLVYLNASIPVPVRIAYAAEILHPDLFEGYGNATFQSYLDKYLDYLNVNSDDGKMDVSKDITTIITYQMYVEATSR